MELSEVGHAAPPATGCFKIVRVLRFTKFVMSAQNDAALVRYHLMLPVPPHGAGHGAHTQSDTWQSDGHVGP